MKNLYIALLISIIGLTTSYAQQSQDLFHYKVGQLDVYMLSEGQQQGNSSILIGATPEMMNGTMPNGTFANATNAFLVRDAERIILIDAGWGKKLFLHLEKLGITPEDIDVVLITHMHGDHIGGMMLNGQLTFPNAEIYIPEEEYHYWTDDDKMNAIPENNRKAFKASREVIRAYGDRVKTFQPDNMDNPSEPILPGIIPIAAYGHTPGHTMYLLTSGQDKLLVWADLTHAMAIQMPYPQIAVTYDINPEDAINSRKKVLEYVTTHKIPVGGMHIAYPGVGQIIKNSGTGYTFIPEKSEK